MGWTAAPVAQTELFHYSEDPTIERFEPHVPLTNPNVSPAVWAIDELRAPLYWFPRSCPRVAVWANNVHQQRILESRFETRASRVQIAPSAWSDATSACQLYEYRFDAAGFAPWPEAEGQWIAECAVFPLTVAPKGELVTRQRRAGVDLRFVDNLSSWRDIAIGSGLPFSIVRLRG